MNHGTILDVGVSPTLQRARQNIFQSAGYTFIATTNAHEAILLASECKIDLIIICDSLDLAEAQRLSHALQTVAPSTPLLQLTNRSTSPEYDSELLLPLARAAVRKPPSRQVLVSNPPEKVNKTA